MVSSPDTLASFIRLLYNPQCFALNENATAMPVNWAEEVLTMYIVWLQVQLFCNHYEITFLSIMVIMYVLCLVYSKLVNLLASSLGHLHIYFFWGESGKWGWELGIRQ